ncbi:hypothetical protein FQR65_LT10315 [Abscondita terminalis]|nr:hypothetical protein FQR65_LT10315 [Abscondita terminalis]
MSIYDIPVLVDQNYPQAATPKNIQSDLTDPEPSAISKNEFPTFKSNREPQAEAAGKRPKTTWSYWFSFEDNNRYSHSHRYQAFDKSSTKI